ncbi:MULTISPECIES: ABC transporter permease [Clostridium]|jgi:putative ABC transport system permease protein|uniref:ABC transporter permease n=1 Tax=Clostridium TaxID=1485 RepID=UPI000DCF671B|nr:MULTISPECIES: ABC transporter permease [Clostridium]MBS5305461.1 ABC transporter permease [Clostridium sp.]MDB1932933.1 ABC transporter permease [Clostridium tertium]MDB1939049.1 ABC transporter permease [Clostridium tertium]MDB1943205.1 ABC transporter permease [Clostridium tertium]MDB1950306.1 ABC transporter permease [Clostridium tertium]
MYSKLAFRNLKRSFKDYTIYFLTLVFGVCIFYTFNSIQSQSIMMELNDMQASAFEQVENIMGYASIFVSFILAFLIIYANNYLIKRRKKEFGIYMTLGMEKGNLSKIIFIETLLVGIISLAIGLGLGILLSQGLSVLTAKMFQVNLIKFKFIFSYNSMIKTIVCFGAIYLLVLMFNSMSIRKISLIDLLTSSRKNEAIKVRNVWVSVIIFMISCIMLGYAYNTVLTGGVATLEMSINGLSILLGSVGTFLFFFSLSGFLLKLVQANKKYYLKDLNMFVLRQINSKINTVFISMSFICLMLFVGICMLSGGLGISSAMNEDIKDLTEYDLTFWNFEGMDIEKVLKENEVDLSKYSDEYVSYINYNGDLKYNDILSEEGREELKDYYPVSVNQPVQIIGLSKFNEIMNMANRERISLRDNEYAIFTDIDDSVKVLDKVLRDNKEININGTILKPSVDKVIEIVAYDNMMKSNICTIVVDDSLISGLVPKNSFLNLNYKDGNSDIQNLISSEVDPIIESKYKTLYYMSKEEILADTSSAGAIIAYLGIYIGGIFLLISAAVLALQQLSESTDNIERYKLLRKIGVDDEIINRSLLSQIGIYFMMPLSLALIHSIVGLEFSKKIITVFGSVSIMNNILISLFVLLVIYGGYFIATYIGAKKNINQRI